MQERAEALFDEIQQIVKHYKEEVPGRRYAWSKAIKQRVCKIVLSFAFSCSSSLSRLASLTVMLANFFFHV